jgi:nitrite reductase/ring-hydroxylating ferredoxin subunit
VGVDTTAFEAWPEDFKAVKGVKDLQEGRLTRGQVDGVSVLLYRKGATIHALSDRCTHRGCSLSDGESDGSAVTCPCHGSRFRLEDGQVLRGPAIAPAKSFQVRERNGKIEVRLPAS